MILIELLAQPLNDINSVQRASLRDAILEAIWTPPEYELFPYQRDGVVEILLRSNVLLADEPGLGKTVQILAAMNIARPPSVLIIVPKAALLLWDRHARAILSKDYLASFDDAEEYELGTADLMEGRNFCITTYEAAARWTGLLTSRRWSWLVYDEGHMIKNADTKRSKALRKIAEVCDKKICVTGSPILNYSPELWPVIYPLLQNFPGLVEKWPHARNVDTYLNRYVTGGRYVRNAEELRRKLRETIMVRRHKKDVLTMLPKKRRQIIEFQVVDETTRKLLDYEKKLFKGKGRSEDEAIEALIMQVNESGLAENEIDWAELIDQMKFTKQYFFEEMSKIRHLTALAKVPYALEHIDDVLENMNGTAKLVVFAHHKDVLQKISEHLTATDRVWCMVTGDTDVHTRERYIHEFQTGGIEVFLAGIRATGIAITLTAASYALFVEEDWSPPIITQAEDRLHRIGQINKVLVQHLVLEDSMDSFIAKKVVNKQRQQDKVLGEGEYATKDKE